MNRRRLVRIAVVAATTCLLVVGGLFGWLRWGWFRAPTEELRWRPVPGVMYERLVLAKPRLAVVHLVTVDLQKSNVQFWTTPADRPDDERPFNARTTTQAAREFDLLLALNGDFFEPSRNEFWNPAPRPGEPTATRGPSASDGRIFAPDKPGYFARRGGTMTFTDGVWIYPSAEMDAAQTAISGGPYLVRNGRVAETPGTTPEPQSAVAYSMKSSRVWLVAVDGRQPRYSNGLTDRELADFLIELGAEYALRLDGGGSTTLALRNPRGSVELVNSPIHCGIPGLERPVANHLGIKVIETYRKR